MHLRPIKRLGQSFLTYEPAADRIVTALELTPADEVLEIGPGKGILTSRLIRFCRQVTAVEIDPRLVAYLRTKLGGAGNLSILEQDILKLDWRQYRNLKVCGNLPYSISSQILFQLLDNLNSWNYGVFTLQREFAQRVVAQPGEKAYGALSVLCELYCERRRLFNLPPEWFKPRPAVVSTVIALRRRPSALCPITSRENFVRLVKAAFSQRRKTLRNNLLAQLGVASEQLAAVEQATGISLARRAETLTVEEFQRLTAALNNA